MRAVVVTPDRDLALTDLDIAPHPGEVLLRVRACGICGSDLHGLIHPNAFGTRAGDVMGHEFCGEVAETGDGVQGWQPGERVVVRPVLACGDCPACNDGFSWRCRRGKPVGLGPGAVGGAYAEYVRATPSTLVRIPDALPDRHAALTEPFAVGLHAVNRARVGPGDSVCIMGAGPVGLFTLLAAKRRRAGPILVSEPAAGRRALCEQLGATATVDPNQEDPARIMREMAGSRPDVVFDAVGTAPTLQEATRLARRNGRVGVVGVCTVPHTLQPLTAIAKELDLHYAFAWSDADFDAALRAIAEGAVPADAIISDVIGLDQVPAMFRALAQPTTQVKVIVEP